MSILKKLMMTAALSAAMFATTANAEPVKIGLVVKSLGNGFFDAANTQSPSRPMIPTRWFRR